MIGLFITARCGSKRLTKKHFRDLNGIEALQIMLDRINAEFQLEIESKSLRVIIVTGAEIENKDFKRFSKNNDLTVFFGSDVNIPFRHKQAMDHYALDGVIAVDGDDIFIAREAMRIIYEEICRGAQFCKTNHFPFGMNAFGYSYAFLQQQSIGDSREINETGWTSNFTGQLVQIGKTNEAYEQLRFTLDYKEDLEFMKKVLSRIHNYVEASTEDFVRVAFNDELYKINHHVNEAYWRNFNEGR